MVDEVDGDELVDDREIAGVVERFLIHAADGGFVCLELHRVPSFARFVRLISNNPSTDWRSGLAVLSAPSAGSSPTICAPRGRSPSASRRWSQRGPRGGR